MMPKVFSIEEHKKRFICYLEVMIAPDGHVEYAVPSHQEWAISYLCKKRNLTREQLCDLTPRDRYLDFMDWLLEESGCVAVWYGCYMGNPNPVQLKVLKEFKDSGIYDGSTTENDVIKMRERLLHGQ